MKYLKLLSKDFSSQMDVRSEIVKLTAQLHLPKGTEYFFSDLHGEQEGFLYLLRSASGIIKEKIRTMFDSDLTEPEKNQLANLIYTPDHMLALLHSYRRDSREWMIQMMPYLLELCRELGSKYTRVRVQSKIADEYRFLIEELLYPGREEGREEYLHDVINIIIENDMGAEVISELCHLIQNLTVERIHIIGDVFDRGPHPDMIMEELISFGDVDIQWGNHDISWMGAVCGNQVLAANVVRMGISYNTFDCLEDGYGINLRPLSSFAQRVYAEDPCRCFMPKILDENYYDRVDIGLAAKMHKAMTIIQLKLLGQLIRRRPEWGMPAVSPLEKIDYEKGVLIEEGKAYPLLDTFFPTIDPDDPLRLIPEEEALMKALTASFAHSEVLNRHVRFMYSHGSMYKKMNGNLLFHGCIPMNEDGSFREVEVRGKKKKGRALLDSLERIVQEAYFLPDSDPQKQNAVDWMWYLWCGSGSPLFGKSKLAFFENYFIEDKILRKEIMDPYYRLSEKREICEAIFREFDMDETHSHIINGHVPVKIKDGEKPVKAEGRLYVIDGGISKAYQSKTGIAGYTMIFNSHYLALAEHHNFMTQREAFDEKLNLQITEKMEKRLLIKDTDAGKAIQERIEDLKDLLAAYRNGQIKEKGRF